MNGVLVQDPGRFVLTVTFWSPLRERAMRSDAPKLSASPDAVVDTGRGKKKEDPNETLRHDVRVTIAARGAGRLGMLPAHYNRNPKII